MKATVILLIVICGLTKSIIREHFYLNIPKNWTSAQSYCRKYYTDLSTISSKEEQNIMSQLTGMKFDWIGLHRNISNITQFLWSDGSPYSFSNWEMYQPNNLDGNQYCVFSHPQWIDTTCNYFLNFFCYRTVFILVKEKKTWEEAHQYCRTHHTDLASITSERQLPLIKSETRESETESVWTGLRFLVGQWFWVSNSPLKIETSLPECPSQPYRCGARNNKTDKWENRDCDEKLNFLCS